MTFKLLQIFDKQGKESNKNAKPNQTEPFTNVRAAFACQSKFKLIS